MVDSGCPDLAVLWFLLRLLDTADPNRPTMAVLLGQRGVGKTQLLTHLGWDFYVIKGTGARYTTAAGLLQHLRRTFDRVYSDDPTFHKVFNEYARAPVLLIDEMEVRYQSDWEFQILTNLIDERYRRRLVTVMASNLSANGFRKLVGESIWSRIGECGRVLECRWPSFRPPVIDLGRKGPNPPHPPRPRGSP